MNEPWGTRWASECVSLLQRRSGCLISTPGYRFGEPLLPLWWRASTQASLLFCGRLVLCSRWSGQKSREWFHYHSNVMKYNSVHGSFCQSISSWKEALKKKPFSAKFMPVGSWVSLMHDPKPREMVGSVYSSVSGDLAGLVRNLVSLRLMYNDVFTWEGKLLNTEWLNYVTFLSQVRRLEGFNNTLNLHQCFAICKCFSVFSFNSEHFLREAGQRFLTIYS